MAFWQFRKNCYQNRSWPTFKGVVKYGRTVYVDFYERNMNSFGACTCRYYQSLGELLLTHQIFFALSFSFNVSIRINFSNADFPYTHPNKKPVYLRYPMQKVDLIPIFVWANLFSLFAQNRDYGRRYLFVGTAKKGFIIWHG